MTHGDPGAIEQARRLSAAGILLDIADSLDADDPDRPDLCQDAITLLTEESDSALVWTLRGRAAWLLDHPQEAILAWRRAVDLGSADALPLLAHALREVGEVEQAATCEMQMRAREDDPGILWARVQAAEQGDGPVPAWVESAVQRAAAGGLLAAQRRRAFTALWRGELAGLAELRRLAEVDPHTAWALGDYLWPFRLYGYLSTDEDEEVEAARLLRQAHDQGELLATVSLWLRSQAPQDAPYEQVLQQFRITAWRRQALAQLLEGEALDGFLVAQARRRRDADDDLGALRLLQAATISGDHHAVDELGRLLLDEADDGPWGAFALFLQRWPRQVGPLVVGSPATPLLASQRLPALRDDHGSSIPIEGSDFAVRILQALEQVGWHLYPLGDHLLVGAWEQALAPVVVLVELPGSGRGERASISIALLAGLPEDLSAPWALPPSQSPGSGAGDDEDADAEGNTEGGVLRAAVGPTMRSYVTHLTAEDTDYWGMQRRSLEALFRVGEFEAAPPTFPDQLPVQIQLSGLEGRRLTFAGVPLGLYPRPWISAGPSDYLVSPGIIDHPQAHRLARPLAVQYVGYDLDARLSGGHLLTALLRVVESLKAINGCVVGMFDRDPGIFNEFFRAIPMARLLHSRDLLDDYLPEQARRPRGRLDLITEYNAAWALMSQGQPDQARGGFERAAAGGQPHALSTVIWSDLLAGDLDRARAAWEEHSAKVPGWIEKAGLDERMQATMWAQWPNCQGNAGLAYAATGDPRAAWRLWREAATAGNREAQAFAAVLARRQGKQDLADVMIAELSERERDQVRAVMGEVCEQGIGWFQDWAKECLSLLDG